MGLPYGQRELPTWGNWLPRRPNFNLDVDMGWRSIGDATDFVVLRAADKESLHLAIVGSATDPKLANSLSRKAADNFAHLVLIDPLDAGGQYGERDTE
jgi:hypothetical protein